MRRRCAVGRTPWPSRRWFRFSTWPGSRSVIDMGREYTRRVRASNREIAAFAPVLRGMPARRPRHTIRAHAQSRNDTGASPSSSSVSGSRSSPCWPAWQRRGSWRRCGRPPSGRATYDLMAGLQQARANSILESRPACSARATRPETASPRTLPSAYWRAFLETVAGRTPRREPCPAGRRGSARLAFAAPLLARCARRKHRHTNYLRFDTASRRHAPS